MIKPRGFFGSGGMPLDLQQLMNMPTATATTLNMRDRGVGMGAPMDFRGGSSDVGSFRTATTQNPMAGMQATQAPVMDFRMSAPRFEDGGMVGPGGMPIGPNTMPPNQGVGMDLPTGDVQMSYEEMDREAQRIMMQNPEVVAELQQGLMMEMQAGNLDMDDIQVLEQYATVAAQNPELYPNLRNYAIQQGMADQEDLPAEYDPGLIFGLLLAARSITQGSAQAGMAVPGQAPMASMRNGGPLPDKSPNADGSVPIVAHEGEYVIPKEVVQAKGTEFFDSLLAKYKK